MLFRKVDRFASGIFSLTVLAKSSIKLPNSFFNIASSSISSYFLCTSIGSDTVFTPLSLKSFLIYDY